MVAGVFSPLRRLSQAPIFAAEENATGFGVPCSNFVGRPAGIINQIGKLLFTVHPTVQISEEDFLAAFRPPICRTMDAKKRFAKNSSDREFIVTFWPGCGRLSSVLAGQKPVAKDNSIVNMRAQLLVRPFSDLIVTSTNRVRREKRGRNMDQGVNSGGTVPVPLGARA
jgi:hypothetical protein